MSKTTGYKELLSQLTIEHGTLTIESMPCIHFGNTLSFLVMCTEEAFYMLAVCRASLADINSHIKY